MFNDRGSKIIYSVSLVIILSFGLIGGCGGSGNNSNQSSTNISFTDVASQAGFNYTHGFISGVPRTEPELISGAVAAGDYDNDGWVDLYVVSGTIGPNLLFRNNGNGTFSDITISASETGVSSDNTFSAAFGDYDLDNDLDLFMTHWQSRNGEGSSEHLWKNNGDNTFTDVSIDSGISETYETIIEYTFTPNFADINNDGYPDILLAADFGTSQIFVN